MRTAIIAQLNYEHFYQLKVNSELKLEHSLKLESAQDRVFTTDKQTKKSISDFLNCVARIQQILCGSSLFKSKT
ncbi:hypothetical protein TTHERM_01818940 (macronuclear) [Tetrahymena thermophila SB210]|uniref:Uncharacterized protein n=1 Tax=Tetrahymena thermophila (strain SB210) TaxID=312017 RepID=Q227J1_TETTS|nr:hypothetical protein TTHERM_01818940 [Tetrahymena thermophila SB210]EAR81457.1 hypothetical protein TTHERM_01818940 [Tetrahymena thermophila SB210]|eukprot:XP_001029120.1 hypothetical protein TTHERM_01818940 [Tetrahymena thermophila SB210]